MSRSIILVIGDVFLDEWIDGEVNRKDPGCDAFVVENVGATRYTLGGAANAAANCAALAGDDFQVYLIGAAYSADQRTRHELSFLLRNAGVVFHDVSGSADTGVDGLAVKTRICAGRKILLRVDRGRAVVNQNDLLDEVEEFARGYGRPSAILLSDYGRGVISFDLSCAISAAYPGVPVVVDPKGYDWYKYPNDAVMTPNRAEAVTAYRHLAKYEGDDEPSPPEMADAFRRTFSCRQFLITCGADGVYLCGALHGSVPIDDEVRREQIPAYRPFDVVDTIGAGDVFVAAVTVGLAAGDHPDRILRTAVTAAGLSVAEVGTTVVSRESVLTAMGGRAVPAGQVCEVDELVTALAERRHKRTVVFTNGCFDLGPHRGHIELLEFARAHGDILVVGVDDDASVRRLKGEDRPVVPLCDRLYNLSRLACVDFVVPFSHDSGSGLLGLVERVQPDVLVKGPDYQGKPVVGANLVTQRGGRVLIAPRKTCVSTSLLKEFAG